MPKVTLSLDNGPDPDVTPGVLETLARHGLQSTFFVIGEKAATPAGRALMERAHAEGHWIGNHTYTHSIPLGEDTDPEAPAREIGRTQDVIGGYSHPLRYFRPFGAGGFLDDRVFSPEARDYLLGGRYTCVNWNCVPRDWEHQDGGWVEIGLDLCGQLDWSLVVVHDFLPDAGRHLDRFIVELKARGFEFTQEFPADCVPMVQGEVRSPIDYLVRDYPLVGWTQEDLVRLRDELQSATVRTLLESCAARAGEHVPFSELVEKVGRSDDDCRADLDAFSALVTRRFARRNWPITYAWSAGGDAQAYYRMAPELAAWWRTG